MGHNEQVAAFRHMREGTEQDWAIIGNEVGPFAKGLPGRLLDHLRLLNGDFGGFPVDRLTHSLQTATLAHRDGQDEEYVVCSLLHDIGDTLGSYNHADVAAVLLEPFVSKENHWMIKHHGIFQGITSSTTWAWTAICAISTATCRSCSNVPRISARNTTRRPSIQMWKRCR